MSLFAQHDYTNYNMIHEHFTKGNEIAAHSVNHTKLQKANELKQQAQQQKDNLENYGHIPKGTVVGWRSPYLIPAGDSQPEELGKLGYTYDISLTYTRGAVSEPAAWPFTLDYGYPYRCGVPLCPSKDVSHAGFWEVPINMLFYNGLPCAYVDACRPPGEAEALRYLRDNFYATYNGNRAPFGLNMHASWFAHHGTLAATQRFLSEILALDDVYVVSVGSVLEWMRKPITAAEAKQSSFGCPSSIHASTPTGTSTSSETATPATMTSPTTTRHPSAAVTSPGNTSHLANQTSTAPTSANGTSAMMTTRPPSTNNPTSSTTRAPASSAMTSTAFPPPSPHTCMQGVNCHLPSCLCRSLTPPGGLSPQQTPQIVYLSFIDDAYGYPAIRKLLKNITNPNGCPITATFFVPSGGRGLDGLRNMSNDGHEIAIYSIASDTNVEERLTAKLTNFQSLNAADRHSTRAGTFGRGIRSPYVNTIGKTLFEVLKRNGVTYDSSLIASRSTSLSYGAWPYTLDFGLQEDCGGGSQCLSELDSYPGLWEVPIRSLVDYKGQFLCLYPDACYNRPGTALETYQMLMDNFQATLSSGRAPMGINLRREWFSHSIYLPNLQGLKQFLTDVTSRGDVYVTSVEKMLDWIRYPVPLAEVGSFESWKC